MNAKDPSREVWRTPNASSRRAMVCVLLPAVAGQLRVRFSQLDVADVKCQAGTQYRRTRLVQTLFLVEPLEGFVRFEANSANTHVRHPSLPGRTFGSPQRPRRRSASQYRLIKRRVDRLRGETAAPEAQPASSSDLGSSEARTCGSLGLRKRRCLCLGEQHCRLP